MHDPQESRFDVHTLDTSSFEQNFMPRTQPVGAANRAQARPCFKKLRASHFTLASQTAGQQTPVSVPSAIHTTPMHVATPNVHVAQLPARWGGEGGSIASFEPPVSRLVPLGLTHSHHLPLLSSFSRSWIADRDTNHGDLHVSRTKGSPKPPPKKHLKTHTHTHSPPPFTPSRRARASTVVMLHAHGTPNRVGPRDSRSAKFCYTPIALIGGIGVSPPALVASKPLSARHRPCKTVLPCGSLPCAPPFSPANPCLFRVRPCTTATIPPLTAPHPWVPCRSKPPRAPRSTDRSPPSRPCRCVCAHRPRSLLRLLIPSGPSRQGRSSWNGNYYTVQRSSPKVPSHSRTLALTSIPPPPPLLSLPPSPSGRCRHGR